LESDKDEDNLLDQIQDEGSSSSSKAQVNVSESDESEQESHASSLPSEEDDQLVLNMMELEEKELDDFSLASQEDSCDGHNSSSQLADDEDSNNGSSNTVE
jgi:hypothetical protein